MEAVDFFSCYVFYFYGIKRNKMNCNLKKKKKHLQGNFFSFFVL